MEIREIAAVVAAIIALVGVLTTVAVSERRARRDSRLVREDAYRIAMRSVLADLLVAAHAYERCARLLSDPTRWLAEGQDRVLDYSKQAAESLDRAERALVVAELSVIDVDLQKLLVELRTSVEKVDELTQEILTSFWERRRPLPLVNERASRLQRYNSACLQLQRAALQALRPTVRDDFKG
jgi:hypothetical protein